MGREADVLVAIARLAAVKSASWAQRQCAEAVLATGLYRAIWNAATGYTDAIGTNDQLVCRNSSAF